MTEDIYEEFRAFLREKEFEYEDTTFLNRLNVEEFILDDMKAMLEEKKGEYIEARFEKNRPYIQYAIKREIARVLWGLEEWYIVFANNDPQVLAALELFPKAEDLMAESKMVR